MVKVNMPACAKQNTRPNPAGFRNFIGYHGTNTECASKLHNSVIEPVGGTNEYLGPGFYITISFEQAELYADKATQDRGGDKVVMEVFADDDIFSHQGALVEHFEYEADKSIVNTCAFIVDAGNTESFKINPQSLISIRAIK